MACPLTHKKWLLPEVMKILYLTDLAASLVK